MMSGLNAQLDQIKTEIKDQNLSTINLKSDDIKTVNIPKVVSISGKKKTTELSFFGYNYFNRDINFFDNIQTPKDFILGPGDEVILSIWGETNIRRNFTINKDGLIFYQNIGFINLANKTMDEAASVLRNEFAKIYSTLSDSQRSSQLSIELGRIKSINVFFSGQVKNPGISLIHPFSDVFTALIQAGGVKKEGSLRKIEIIRSNKVLTVIDFYSFFKDGKNSFSNIRLIDGDIIHIPEVNKRVALDGAVVNKAYFELLNNESLDDLIVIAGGLLAEASSSIIVNSIIPSELRQSDDFAKSSETININESSEFIINNGDQLLVKYISDVISKVIVRGNVKNPGEYPSNTNLKEVLDLAGGFSDPEYRKSIFDEILVLRKDESQFYNIEIKVKYDDSDNFKLFPSDNIFVYENNNFSNPLSYRVFGAVNKPGYFPYKKGLTIKDAISMANGHSPLSSFKYTINYNNLTVKGGTINSAFDPGAEIEVLDIVSTISVVGNVYSPGTFTFDSTKSVAETIRLAGGYMKRSNKKNIYIESIDGTRRKANIFARRLTSLDPGDKIIIPKKAKNDFNVTSFTSDILATLMNILAIATLIDKDA
jgi:protein involved in polysaccharide export with SLBB domain